VQPVPEQPADAVPPNEPAEPYPVEIYLKEKMIEIRKNVDETHDRLEQNILKQTIRLDSFFGNPKSGDELKSGYQLRLRNSVRVEQGGNLKFGVSLRANLTLSKISERLRLYVSGENEPEPFAPSLPEDPGNPGFDRPAQTTKIANTEIRYGVYQTPLTDIFMGAGFRLVLPFEAFVRSRVQHTHHINDVTQVRAAETLFVNNIVGAGETTEVTVERLLDPKDILRWASTATISHEIRGVDLGTELSLIRELSPKSAVTLTGGVYGNSSLDDTINNYRLFVRYRRNFLRSWLFYELTPEVSWPRQADGNFPTNYACTFLLEVVFQGSSAEKKPVMQ
jgi:hypothetical protein